MALVNCGACGAPISSFAGNCPRCGVSGPGAGAAQRTAPTSAVSAVSAPAVHPVATAATHSAAPAKQPSALSRAARVAWVFALIYAFGIGGVGLLSGLLEPDWAGAARGAIGVASGVGLAMRRPWGALGLALMGTLYLLYQLASANNLAYSLGAAAGGGLIAAIWWYLFVQMLRTRTASPT